VRAIPSAVRYKVAVVGSFVEDLTWRCADFPRPGETVIGAFVAGGDGGPAVALIGAADDSQGAKTP